MFKVEKIDEHNKQRFVECIKSDIIKHVFAFYDVQNDPEHTATYAAFQKNHMIGYILTYTATDVLSVILESEEDAAETLIAHAPENHFIMHTTPNLLPVIKRKFPNAKDYIENWMLIRKTEASFYNSRLVKRLLTEEDAALLANLLLQRTDRPKRMMKKYIEWITKLPIYGVFKKDVLVSYAGSFIQLPQVWMIGGVYTDPKHRNKGYALLATSAVTEEALGHSEAAALFVRSDNYPAIRVYEKIGYRKIGEKLWIDVGTGLRP
ncbi:MAG: GNAT family N-acetyltransferase [Candidatus Bathyarchaeia archaeon]|jgi:RimJ/RimL family protein N-acetyltransferase